MCEPTTIAIASLALTAVGTGASFLGQMNQQAAAGAQQSYLAQQARQRQMIADQQANDAKQRGEVNVQRQRDITAQRIGTQRAALAAQGTDLEGSPTDILGDTARSGEFDALTLRNNAAREAYGYQVQGAGFGADAAMRESFQPSYLGAGASLLTGASSLADKWTKFKQNDPGGGLGGGSGTVF
jgi:hypothetical protein